MTYEEYLAVPYVLVAESVRRADGEWVRRVSYPELPNCAAEAETPIEALEQLEILRQRRITEMLDRGEPVPVPRPPLRSGLVHLDPERLEFARWMVESGRIHDDA